MSVRVQGEEAATDQRGAAGAAAQRLVEGRAAELQLLQVAVWDADVSRQRQTLVQVLKAHGVKCLCLNINSFHGNSNVHFHQLDSVIFDIHG